MADLYGSSPHISVTFTVKTSNKVLIYKGLTDIRNSCHFCIAYIVTTLIRFVGECLQLGTKKSLEKS
jgi:hypothetical protein